jgi:hypothetical protein
VRYASISASANRIHYLKTIEQLTADSGLDDYRALGDSVDASNRLWRALELAQKRHDERPESERVLAPSDAIRMLTQTIISTISYVGTSFDDAMIRSVPSLAPFIPLAAVLEVVEKNVQSTTDIIGGRLERARRGYLEVLQRLNEPDHGGIGDLLYERTRLTILNTIATIEASLGRASALKWIGEFESQPLFQVNGWRIQMIYYMRQGDTQKAIECKKRLELLQLQNSPGQFFEGTYSYTELLVYASSDDLGGVKQTIENIQAMANKYEAWVPILCYARAEYQRIRGDYASALFELDQALTGAAAGTNMGWPYFAAAYITTLFELGRYQEANDVGIKFLNAAEDEALDISTNVIRRALALAKAKLGEIASATSLLDIVIEQYLASEITGLTLGLAYEARARVAIYMGDDEGFKRYAKLCAEQYKAGHNPALAAKYAKLMREGSQAKVSVTDELARAIEMSEIRSAKAADFASRIASEVLEPQERLDRLLDFLVKSASCSGGLLYGLGPEGPRLVAQNGELEVTPEVAELARRRLLAEASEDLTTADEEQETPQEGSDNWVGPQGDKYYPLVLGHTTPEGFAVAGLAVLRVNSDNRFEYPSELIASVSKVLFSLVGSRNNEDANLESAGPPAASRVVAE